MKYYNMKSINTLAAELMSVLLCLWFEVWFGLVCALLFDFKHSIFFSNFKVQCVSCNYNHQEK